MAFLIPAETDILAGIELGGVPLATALSLETDLPARFIRKQAKTYGTCHAVEGGDVNGKKCLIVEDVISTGGAVTDAAFLLREEGAVVSGVLCAVWRGDGRPTIASLPDIPVFALFSSVDLPAPG